MANTWGLTNLERFFQPLQHLPPRFTRAMIKQPNGKLEDEKRVSWEKVREASSTHVRYHMILFPGLVIIVLG